jgi:hypothetical protein
MKPSGQIGPVAAQAFASIPTNDSKRLRVPVKRCQIITVLLENIDQLPGGGPQGVASHKQRLRSANGFLKCLNVVNNRVVAL